MSFIDRVKRILLAKNEEELTSVEAKIAEVEILHSEKLEDVNSLKKESEIALGEKSEVQRNVLSKNDLKELETIYEFIVNYPQIEKIANIIKDTSAMLDSINVDFSEEIYIHELDEELYHRLRLYVVVKKINEEIERILSEDTSKESEEKQDNSFENPKPVKSGIFSKLFKRDKDSVESQKGKKEEKIFNRYRRTIGTFYTYYNNFFVIENGVMILIDKNYANITMTNINTILANEKRGFELLEEERLYLDSVKPKELWKELSKYYSSIMSITTIIQNFEARIDDFERMYKEKPELFNIENLERIFRENNQMVIDLRHKNKVATAKSGKVSEKRQEEKEIRAQLRRLEEKRALIKNRNKKIREAGSLGELGYKSKEDAVKKLAIDTKDYIIIPISKKINSIDTLFEEEKRLKVEVDGEEYFTSYVNDVATGRINTIEEESQADAVLMVPISDLKKDNIDSIKGGKVSVNKSVLDCENLIAFVPDGRYFDFENSKVKVIPAKKKGIFKQVEEFLGEDYTKNLDETINYDIFKGVPNISSKDKKLKRNAVKKCLIENVRREISSKDTIHVNGKAFSLNKDDEDEIREESIGKPLDEKKLYNIADEIENYILEEDTNTIKIDAIYQKLLLEYMRVNRKAKADYYEEDNTTVFINGKKVSIKPSLPTKDKTIAKRYSRSNEDITYKVMKLAALINKFAHLTENQELQNSLFETKLELIEYAIDVSKDNPNISLKRKFDDLKMLMSVVLEIPGYNMIALHTRKKSSSLTYKTNKLEESTVEVPQSSTLLIPGVNKKLLTSLKGMKEAERGQFLLDMPPEVFYKLVLRMGYTSENILSEKDRNKFIKQMISDKKIDELLKETEELEK